jgi:hypothetical protein
VRPTTERRARISKSGAAAARAIALCACALGSAASAQETAGAPRPLRGRLTVSFAEYMECAVDNAFVRGENVMLSGGSFLPNEPVSITLVQDSGELPVATVRATPRGGLSAIVAIPAATEIASEVRLRANAAKGDSGGGVILRSPPLRIFAERRDSDGDGFLDHCDTCPALAGENLEDSDVDGLGDACDACANDADNDSDADGLCADVDPNPYAPAGAAEE